MDLLREKLLFASDATLLSLAGFILLVLAGLAGWMDYRRQKRGDINRVGWVPWTPIFLSLAMLGCGLLAMAVPAMVRG